MFTCSKIQKSPKIQHEELMYKSLGDYVVLKKFFSDQIDLHHLLTQPPPTTPQQRPPTLSQWQPPHNPVQVYIDLPIAIDWSG